MVGAKPLKEAASTLTETHRVGGSSPPFGPIARAHR